MNFWWWYFSLNEYLTNPRWGGDTLYVPHTGWNWHKDTTPQQDTTKSAPWSSVHDHWYMNIDTMAELQYRCIRELEEGINLQSTVLKEGINYRALSCSWLVSVGCVHTTMYIPSGRFVRYSFSENITIKNSFCELPQSYPYLDLRRYQYRCSNKEKFSFENWLSVLIASCIDIPRTNSMS